MGRSCHLIYAKSTRKNQIREEILAISWYIWKNKPTFRVAGIFDVTTRKFSSVTYLNETKSEGEEKLFFILQVLVGLIMFSVLIMNTKINV